MFVLLIWRSEWYEMKTCVACAYILYFSACCVPNSSSDPNVAATSCAFCSITIRKISLVWDMPGNKLIQTSKQLLLTTMIWSQYRLSLICTFCRRVGKSCFSDSTSIHPYTNTLQRVKPKENCVSIDVGASYCSSCYNETWNLW